MALLRTKNSNLNRLDPKDYEKLGRDFEDILIKDYIDVMHSTPRQIWSSFTRGAFAGLGGVLGATIGVALLLGALSLFDKIPFIGEVVKTLSETIRNVR